MPQSHHGSIYSASSPEHKATISQTPEAHSGIEPQHDTSYSLPIEHKSATTIPNVPTNPQTSHSTPIPPVSADVGVGGTCICLTPCCPYLAADLSSGKAILEHRPRMLGDLVLWFEDVSVKKFGVRVLDLGILEGEGFQGQQDGAGSEGSRENGKAEAGGRQDGGGGERDGKGGGVRGGEGKKDGGEIAGDGKGKGHVYYGGQNTTPFDVSGKKAKTEAEGRQGVVEQAGDVKEVVVRGYGEKNDTPENPKIKQGGRRHRRVISDSTFLHRSKNLWHRLSLKVKKQA